MGNRNKHLFFMGNTDLIETECPNPEKVSLTEQAYRMLGGALTKAEIGELSYTEELMKLPPPQLKTIVGNIQWGRSDHFSNTFLRELHFLLDKGIQLSDFANIAKKDQREFIRHIGIIDVLMTIGVPFEKLAQLNGNNIAALGVITGNIWNALFSKAIYILQNKEKFPEIDPDKLNPNSTVALYKLISTEDEKKEFLQQANEAVDSMNNQDRSYRPSQW